MTRPPHDRAGAGALDGRAAHASCWTAPRCRCSRASSAIFGHGNVLGLGTALYEVRDELPTWRGQNEQGMALAAVAFARATDRRQVMVGDLVDRARRAEHGHRRRPRARQPAAAAAAARRHVRRPRRPTRCCSRSSTSATRRPRSTTRSARSPRYFDRITRPEQLLATLPQVARVLTDPADAGPVVLALPQDVQVEEFDFPRGDVRRRGCTGCRGRDPTASARRAAAALLRAAQRPLLVVGGGVRYSGAGASAARPSPRHTAYRSWRRVAGRDAIVPRPPAARRPARHHRLHLGQRPRRARPTSCSPSAPGCRTSPPPRGRVFGDDVRGSSPSTPPGSTR